MRKFRAINAKPAGGPALIAFFISFSLTFCLYAKLHNFNASFAQSDACIYRSGSRLVMATVVTRLRTYAFGPNGPELTNKYYAEGIDLPTGKLIWRTPLGGADEFDRDFGGARLLGQSAKYLFFFRNRPFVIDKNSGLIVGQNESYSAIVNTVRTGQVSGNPQPKRRGDTSTLLFYDRESGTSYLAGYSNPNSKGLFDQIAILGSAGHSSYKIQ